MAPLHFRVVCNYNGGSDGYTFILIAIAALRQEMYSKTAFRFSLNMLLFYFVHAFCKVGMGFHTLLYHLI